MKKLTMFFCMVLLLLGFSNITNATLYNRGNGLIYDDDLDITYLDQVQSGLNWHQAFQWVDSLVYAGYDNWRLPSFPDGDYVWDGPGGNPNAWLNLNESELGDLYYNELGNTTASGFTNFGIFQTLSYGGIYWSISHDDYDNPSWFDGGESLTAWYLHTFDGSQSVTWKTQSGQKVLAVHDGDIGSTAPVPEPATMFLLGSGLVGLAGFRRKYKK